MHAKFKTETGVSWGKLDGMDTVTLTNSSRVLDSFLSEMAEFLLMIYCKVNLKNYPGFPVTLTAFDRRVD